MASASIRVALSTLAIAIVGVCAFGSGLDRMAAAHDKGWTLAGFRGFSSDETATRHLLARDLKSALQAARTHLHANPLDARASSLIGATRLAQGDFEAANAAFLVAGSLGWRNRATQLYLMSTALANGDTVVAAQRLDALMRTGSSDPAYQQALASIEATEGGRAALAERLRLGPIWKDRQLLDLSGLTDTQLTNRIDTIYRSEQRGMPVDCDARAVEVNRAFKTGAIGIAAGLWVGTCGGDGVGSAIADGGFDTTDGYRARNPFEWATLARGGTEIRYVSGPRALPGRALYVRSDSPASAAVVQQLLTVDPGSYRLSWDAVAPEGQPTDALSAQIVCPETRSTIARGTSEATQVRHAVDFTVPSAGCTVQAVQIVKQAGSSREAWIDNVTIVPVGN